MIPTKITLHRLVEEWVVEARLELLKIFTGLRNIWLLTKRYGEITISKYWEG